MPRHLHAAVHRASFSRGVGVLLSLVLLAGLLPPITAASGALRAHPWLLELAAQRPAERTRVVVQSTAGADAEALAVQLGATIADRLPMIRAFAAELPAALIPRLASYAAVRWISPDAALHQSDCTPCVGAQNLASSYLQSIRAPRAWSEPPYAQGQGIGVAVVDSGINPQPDLATASGQSRVTVSQVFGVNRTPLDGYGHGTHVAGIIGGDGDLSAGGYLGVAPMVNLINVKVSDNTGSATLSSLLQGLQWILDNRETYNIRVVNLSLNSAVPEAYHASPLDAAAEILWFNKIVVVAAAGNIGKGPLYPPANDPFVITVGATDDRGTPVVYDDVVASFSPSGLVSGRVYKPDLVAPGVDIVAALPASDQTMLQGAHPDHQVNDSYFRMSGTSMSAPMVAGAAALLLQRQPNLTPDQVKFRLMATANRRWPAYSLRRAGAGMLDVANALRTPTYESANLNHLPSRMLSTGSEPIAWNSVNWNSVNWNSVNWNSVNWNSVNWNSVNWNSDVWEE